ncbi:MAG: tetratricopeptide repeat protein [Eubacteriales bacterium]|nr:tetratricopeptide repeat protein [Eubacteriales bacterium]
MKNKIKLTKRIILTFSLVLIASFCNGCGSKDTKTFREEGIEYYKSGEYDQAIQSFNKALNADKGKVGDIQLDILKYRGECELRLGRYEDAKKTYEALIIADDSKENSAYYDELKKDLDSLDEIKKAVDELEQGKYEEAYDIFDSYAKLDGSLKGKLAWFNKGVCAEYMQRYDEAYELFNQYLKVYPEDEAAMKEINFLKTR